MIGHLTYTEPLVFVVMLPAFHNLDRGLEEAAMDLGARTGGRCSEPSIITSFPAKPALDEPLGALDLQVRKRMQNALADGQPNLDAAGLIRSQRKTTL